MLQFRWLAPAASQTEIAISASQAYFALRRSGALGAAHSAYEGTPGSPAAPAISRVQLAEAMAKSGATLDEQQLQALHHLLAEDENSVYEKLTRRGSEDARRPSFLSLIWGGSKDGAPHAPS
jgi:hypothetical protein